MEDQELETIIDYFDDNKTVYIVYQVNKRGEYHGFFKSFWYNGQLECKCFSVNNKPVGIYKYWHPNGSVNKMTQWKKGDTHGILIEFEY